MLSKKVKQRMAANKRLRLTRLSLRRMLRMSRVINVLREYHPESFFAGQTQPVGSRERDYAIEKSSPTAKMKKHVIFGFSRLRKSEVAVRCNGTLHVISSR